MSEPVKAGPMLDAKIAKQVMGWVAIEACHQSRSGHWYVLSGVNPNSRPNPNMRQEIAEYSTDIAAAFSVVEAMKAKGYRWRIGTGAENESPTYAAFWNPEHTFAETYSAECSTPAFAICLAALRAIAASTPPGNPQ